VKGVLYLKNNNEKQFSIIQVLTMAYTLQTIITHNYYKKKQIDGTCSIAIGSIMRVMVYYGGYPFVVHELPLENCALLYKASPAAQSG
jgi:hypothetical protein